MQNVVRAFSHNKLKYIIPTIVFLSYYFLIPFSCIGLGYVMLMLLWGFDINLFGSIGYVIVGLVVFALLFILKSAGKGAFLEMLYKEKSDIKYFLSLISKKGLHFTIIFFIKDIIPSAFLLGGGIAFSLLPQPLSIIAFILSVLIFIILKIIFFYLQCPLIVKDGFGIKESIMALVKRPGDGLFLIVITGIIYFLLLFPIINIAVVLILLPIIWKARIKTFEMICSL